MPVKVYIIDLYDGFNIHIVKNGTDETYFHFDQEDSRERLVDVFKSLGVDCEYEENY